MSVDTNLIYRGDCYTVLKRYFPENNIDLIYVDPPFSFDPKYARLWYDKDTLQMFEEIRKGDVKHYIAWMSKRLEQCHRVLKDNGSIYLHCDWKFGHYLKVEMDNIFGRNNFQNELIWYYQTGGASKKRYSKKHDTLFFYTKGGEWTFNSEDIKIRRTEKALKRAQIPKGARIKATDIYKNPDDVLIIPQMNPMAKERTGYLTQKPEALLEVIIKASSNPTDIVLDPMCGCGTTIVVAHKLDRRWIGIDISSQACEIMKERMEGLEGITEVEVRGLSLTIKDLKELDAFEFEDYICDMTNSLKTQHVADKGIDGYYLGETPLQIKQQERVGRMVVDEFETALRRKNKNKGYVVAFSFTKGAYEEAARAKDDELDIKLVDMNELIKSDYDLEALLE
jgi:DNA modification methylase